MMTNLTKLRVAVLGSKSAGKSAVTVRYLTRRYIGEYSSNTDFLYHHAVTFDDIPIDVEILDASHCQSLTCLVDHLEWADALVIVYSICDHHSFQVARDILERLVKIKGTQLVPVILLGNKRDLEHSRQVHLDDGHETSLAYSCQFYEVSAADSSVGVTLAFQSVIREARAAQLLRSLPGRRRTGSSTVSRMIGMVFGKNNAKQAHHGKKRPSLSI